MGDQPSFKYNEHKNDFERLVKELIDDLSDVTRAFVNINSAHHKDQILPNAIVAGMIGHCGLELIRASNYLEKGQILLFVSECKDMFNCYMNDILENEVSHE